jgi:hypothetical protein
MTGSLMMKPYCDDPKNLQPSGIDRHIYCS